MDLDALIEARRRWIEDRKREGVEGVFRAQAIALPLPPSFHDAVRIAQVERALIAGFQRNGADHSVKVSDFARSAEAAGACAIAIWPDEEARGCSYHDILETAQATCLPILSRDPVVDPLQLVMARAHGAAAVTLVVATLSDDELRALFRHALELGLDVLVEVRSALELERTSQLRRGPGGSNGVRLIGLHALDGHGGLDVGLLERLTPGVPELAAPIVTDGVLGPGDLGALDAQGLNAFVLSEPLNQGQPVEEAIGPFAGAPLPLS